jgi:hypothetical protein
MTRFLLAWMADSPVGDWVNSSAYIWPTLECIHFASLCVLMGSLLVIDLRLVGFYRERCAPMIPWMIRLALGAFVANFLTGLLFIAGNTFKYVDNPAFEIKLLLILAAGVNALVYRFRLHQLVDTTAVTPLSIAVGYLSLALWVGVIICGRMITFFAVPR